MHYPSIFPLKKYKNESILGITTKQHNTCSVEYDNLLSFLKNLLNKVFFYKQQKCFNILVNQIKIQTKDVDYGKMFKLMNNKEERKKIIDMGVELAEEYLQKKMVKKKKKKEEEERRKKRREKRKRRKRKKK